MNNEGLILEIYNSTVNELLSNVDVMYREELKLAYYNRLKNVYENFDMSDSKKSIQELAVIFIKLEKAKWKDLSMESKLSEFLLDSALDNIRDISNKGYMYAKERVNINFEQNKIAPVIDEKLANQSIQMMNNCIGEVREFNKQLANYYISEGTLDYEFASGLTENTSLRIGRLRR